MYLIVQSNNGEWKQISTKSLADVVIDSAKRRLYVYGMDGEEYTMPATLEDSLEILSECGFVKANKNTIANVSEIQDLNNVKDRTLIIGERKVPFSRRNYSDLSKMIEFKKDK